MPTDLERRREWLATIEDRACRAKDGSGDPADVLADGTLALVREMRRLDPELVRIDPSRETEGSIRHDRPAPACEHLNFAASVEVMRIVEHLEEGDEGRKPQKGDDAFAFRAVIRVECSACGAGLGFRCPAIGDRPDQPAVSPNALELRVPLISPAELELLGPLAAMRSSDGLPGFSVRRKA